jgi:beta-glucanase (GH16 family)
VELEWYLPGQVSVRGGALHLTVQKEQVLGADREGSPRWFPYRSGMVTTAGHYEFTYGQVEFQARAPRGRGLWPALWLLPGNESWPPEIDIMEAHGEDADHVMVSYHRTRSEALQAVVPVTGGIGTWHLYALDWRPDSLTWYVDQRPVFSVQRGVPHQPMYLLANLAMAGDTKHAPDSTTPASTSFDIAQVRVWRNQ